MSDDELLILAAKAAGIIKGKHRFCINEDGPMDDAFIHQDGIAQTKWNPLTEDADAFRLAVTLSLRTYVYIGSGDDFSICGGDNSVNSGKCDHQGNPYIATRRAIVLAAAEIGKSKP